MWQFNLLLISFIFLLYSFFVYQLAYAVSVTEVGPTVSKIMVQVATVGSILANVSTFDTFSSHH